MIKKSTEKANRKRRPGEDKESILPELTILQGLNDCPYSFVQARHQTTKTFSYPVLQPAPCFCTPRRQRRLARFAFVLVFIAFVMLLAELCVLQSGDIPRDQIRRCHTFSGFGDVFCVLVFFFFRLLAFFCVYFCI